MADVIGSEAGGYATVIPTENYVGQAIQNVEDNAFKYREEKRLAQAQKDKLAQAKQEALDKQTQQELDDAEKLDKIKANDSGISGIDSAVINGMAAQRQKYIDATNNYRNTRDKKYLVERSAAINNLQSITNIPDSYKKAVDSITAHVTDGTIDKSELKRITALGDKIEKGYIVPKIENGTMSFDVYERDPNTGKLSSIAINNMKGEDLINELTPQKKFDYNKHIKEQQNLAGNSTTIIKNGMEVTGYPNADKYAAQKTNQLFSDQNLLDNVAQLYGIEEDPKTGTYSPEDKKAIYNRYYSDIISGLNTGQKPNYEAERLALARQKEARQARKENGETKSKSFAPPVSTVEKTGFSENLGFKVNEGNKIIGSTYEKGKDGPIKGAVINDDGSYSFSIISRKDNSLNATGLASKKAFEKDPKNTGTEYEPIDSDYVYSAVKPTKFNSKKEADVINTHVRGMINPKTGEYFQNFKEYKQVYDPYKPKKTNNTTAKKKETAAERAIRIANQV